MQRPSLQFYPGDWLRDAGLRACSVGARGCWIEMICVMHQAEPYGHLRINGQPVSVAILARMVGATAKEVGGWIDELKGAGVFDVDEDGAIVSRRMVRDEQTRLARASGGKAGAEHGDKGGSHGPKGGRPRKAVDPTQNPPQNPPSASAQNPPCGDEQNPPTNPPLLSSSSSSKDLPPNPLDSGGRKSRAISFATFVALCKAKGEKVISDYGPVLRYAEQAKLPDEFVILCWDEFKRRYSPGGSSDTKRYIDWRKTFLNCIQGNWYGLWYAREEGVYELTTKGLQAKAVNREREAA